MMAHQAAPQGPKKGRFPLWRAILFVLWGLTVAGAVLIDIWPYAAPGDHATPIAIQIAPDANRFRQAFCQDWLKQGDRSCEAGPPAQAPLSPLSTLRHHLALDAMLFVPGYVGLLCFFSVVLHGTALPPERKLSTGWLLKRLPFTVPTALQIAIVLVAVAAGVYNIAEDGMTARAAEDLFSYSLANATVADIYWASTAKWLLLAASLLLLGLLSIATARVAGRQGQKSGRHIEAGVLALVASVLLAAAFGGLISLSPASTAQLARAAISLTMISLALLSWWKLTNASDKGATGTPTVAASP
jgi:hypothetical protein